MKTLVIGLGLTLALLGQQASATSKPKKERTCSHTATVAYTACVYDVLDSFWISTGKCKNTADANERAQCLSDLRSFPRDGREECSDQKEARIDLCSDIGEAPYDPPFEPSLFVNPNDIGGSVAPNTWYPLIAGQTRLFRSGNEEITITVTDKVELISGVPCRVVTDTVRINGEVEEDTTDWFAQDIHGNVWYCGESTAEYADGRPVNVDGSFKAGENGAKAGIVMKAAPMLEDTYRQEFDLGNAEDVAEVISLNSSATVPAASCLNDCLVTEDTTPLTPDALENKYYKPGVGVILEIKPATGERLELVEMSN
jgi:hypothetical protein